MNEISRLFTFLIGKFRQDPLVNTISTVRTERMDDIKENVYPIVNLDIVSSDLAFPDAETISVTYQITVLQQRDVIPEVTDNKLLEDTNWIDNFNECHSICNKFLTNLLRQNNDENISVESISSVTFIDEGFLNGLDGCQVSVTLVIKNNVPAC